MYSYYMTQRPPQIGAMPRKGLVEIDEFDGKPFIEEIGWDAWAKITYDRELTPDEVSDYELIPAKGAEK